MRIIVDRVLLIEDSHHDSHFIKIFIKDASQLEWSETVIELKMLIIQKKF